MTATLPAETSARSARTARIPVAVLGATGSVGQRFVQLLEHHPWFRLHEVVASERSAGRNYAAAADWRLDTLLPNDAAALTVKNLGSELESRLLFSGLDSSVAGDAEEHYANRGCAVVSNSKNHRMGADVPLLLPEINADHLGAIERQRARRGGGYIVTNSNCSTMGLALAIAPIERRWGIDQLHVTTMQAVSGAGYNGVSSLAILDNVIPYISGEEEKIEIEPRKILGTWNGERFVYAPMRISAQTNRVPTIDGHLMTISLILVRDEPDRPQPRLDRDREHGMAVSVGRVRPCNLLHIRMVALVHNTIRGAAGAALLNAELLDAKGLL